MTPPPLHQDVLSRDDGHDDFPAELPDGLPSDLPPDLRDHLPHLLAERLPISMERLEDVLRGQGLSPPPKNLTEIARLFRTRRGQPPFRVVRVGGMEIAVNRDAFAMATGLVTAAVNMVRFWGLASAPAVIDRTRAQIRSPVVEPAAMDLLAALPRARWLDDARKWFTLNAPNGRLEVALDKIFSLTARVKLDELIVALAKSLPGARHAPADVMRRYLVEIDRCEINGPWIRRAPSARRPPSDIAHRPTRQEASLIRLLTDAPGELGLEDLRRRARAVALPRTTVNQLIQLSPLFIVTSHQRVRLIGDGHAAIYD
jgi:hypothetical protein